VTRIGDFSAVALTLWLLALVRITVPWETLLIEDFEGEALDIVEVGVCGPLICCRCLDVKDWKDFVGVVGTVRPATSLRFELAVWAPGECLAYVVAFRGVTTALGSLEGDFVIFPFEGPIKTRCQSTPKAEDKSYSLKRLCPNCRHRTESYLPSSSSEPELHFAHMGLPPP